MSKNNRWSRRRFATALAAWIEKGKTKRTPADFAVLLRDTYDVDCTPGAVRYWKSYCKDGPVDKTWVPKIEAALGLKEGGLGE